MAMPRDIVGRLVSIRNHIPKHSVTKLNLPNIVSLRLCDFAPDRKKKCNLSTQGAPGVHKHSFEMTVQSRIEFEFAKCWFLRRGKTGLPSEKRAE